QAGSASTDAGDRIDQGHLSLMADELQLRLEPGQVLWAGHRRAREQMGREQQARLAEPGLRPTRRYLEGRPRPYGGQPGAGPDLPDHERGAAHAPALLQ